MSNFLVKTLSNEISSEKILAVPNKRIKLVRAFSMDDLDFMMHPSLTLKITYRNAHGEYIISRSFASFIDPYQPNSRVIEFPNFVFPTGEGILLEIENKGENKKLLYKVGIAYELL